MKSKQLIIYSITFVLLINSVNAWYESSKCTISQTDTANSNEDDDVIDNSGRLNTDDSFSKVLKLVCPNNNLIFVAWSHYGQHLKTHSSFQSNNKSDECYFSPKDCTVSVDYVANECNGLNSCLINLDSQYLHSCKSYSDYIFIIYDCIETKSTVNICDTNANLDTALLAQSNQDSINTAIYLQTPNYPNEYLSNLDCNCTLRTTTTNTQSYLNPLEFELLEFDMESTTSSVEIYSPNVKSSNLCTKDYFSITNQNESQSTRLCGTFTPFLNLNHPQSKRKLQSSETNLRFYSDDALTRRGFWIKVKSSQFNECPDNFILIDNTCIRIYANEMLTWYEAQSFCSEKGYSLAIIDNFELDKQINRALFGNIDSDLDENETSLNKLKQTRKQQPTINLSKFWTGLKHLNETNWFDYKNELIKFKNDEHKWFPWLVVDSSTYNIGSCVAKRQNWLFLEDCYKRMPFACQYKPKQFNKSAKKTRIQLKCGKNVNFLNDYTKSVTTSPTSTTTTTTTTKSNTFSKSKSLPPLILVHNSNEIIDNQLNDTNLAGFSKQSIVEDHRSVSGNSTLLISLISSITLLIAFINTIVILVICKRRKLLLQNNSEKDSKLSSHDTISSSGHNINFDEMTTSAGTNSSSSLTFSARNSNKNAMFAQTSTSNEPIFLDTNNNNNNFRRSIFVNNNNKTLQPQVSRNTDPLGHIYETISVSSSNSNLANLTNIPRYNTTTNQSNYNLFNHYHLHQQQQSNQNNYNEPDLNVNTSNMIIMNDSEMNMNKKFYKPIHTMNHGAQSNRYTNKVLSPTITTNFRPISASSNHQKQLATIGNNRFSDLNISNSNSSSSPSSSTTTTLTDVLNQSNLLNSSMATNKNFILVNSNQMIPNNNRHLLLCSSNDLLLQQQQQQLIQTFARNSFKNVNHLIHQNLDQQHIQHLQSTQNNKSRTNISIQSSNNHGPLNFINNPVEAIV